MKLGISLDEDLLKRADAFADKNYMSRSGLISLSLTAYLNSAEFVGYMRDLTLCVRKIADSGVIDHETMEQIEDLERVAKLLSGGFKA